MLCSWHHALFRSQVGAAAIESINADRRQHDAFRSEGLRCPHRCSLKFQGKTVDGLIHLHQEDAVVIMN